MEDEHSSAAPAKLYFSGHTDYGELGLALPGAATVSSAPTGPEQVLQLSRTEPLICAVEDWLQTPWDPAPTTAAEHTSHQRGSYEAVVHDPALAPPGTILLIPHQAVLVMPSPVLCAPALSWQACRAELLLSRVPQAALAQLQSGALLWLAEACGPDWPVWLHDATQRLPNRAARLDLDAQHLAFDVDGMLASHDDDEPQVWLAQTIELPLDQWLRWPATTGNPPQQPITQPWRAQLRWRNTIHARGHLLPAGQGCGLLLHSVTPTAATTHGTTGS